MRLPWIRRAAPIVASSATGVLGVVGVMAVLGACSSKAPPSAGDPMSGDTPCPGPFRSTADLSAAVSFAADVMPVFAQHCAVGGGTCHGDTPTLPYLGVPDGSVNPASVLAKIVGVPSGEDPAMNFVAPGDPSQSYLMHKIDGDACTLAKDCASSVYGVDFPTCGATMPFLSPMLPVATRDLVRAWIAEGAKND